MSEHNIPSVPYLVLLSHIAHIKEFLIVEGEKLPSPIQVSETEDRSHRPENHFLYHEHAYHRGSESTSCRISSSTTLDIVIVFALGNVHPILLACGLVVTHSAVQHVLLEVGHAEVDSHLVIRGDTSMILVK